MKPIKTDIDRLCIQCANARNQYLQPYSVPTDDAQCLTVANLVTGTNARCEELRKPGVQMSRCGEGGALWLAIV